MYVCLYVCMSVCLSVCLSVCMYVCMCVYIYIFSHIDKIWLIYYTLRATRLLIIMNNVDNNSSSKCIVTWFTFVSWNIEHNWYEIVVSWVIIMKHFQHQKVWSETCLWQVILCVWFLGLLQNVRINQNCHTNCATWWLALWVKNRIGLVDNHLRCCGSLPGTRWLTPKWLLRVVTFDYQRVFLSRWHPRFIVSLRS